MNVLGLHKYAFRHRVIEIYNHFFLIITTHNSNLLQLDSLLYRRYMRIYQSLVWQMAASSAALYSASSIIISH